jgi:transmembrane sensor
MKEMKKTESFTDREWELLASRLSGESTDQDELVNRFKADDFSKAAEQWRELGNMHGEKNINVDKAWENLHERINANEREESKEIPVVSFFATRFFRVAATLLILLSVGSTLLYLANKNGSPENITFTTGNDQKNLIINLPDGSIIALNRNSELSYTSDFGEKGRNVKLTGEAFFEISPDASKPFIIDAGGNAKVKVVGTSFNVITMNSESSVEVFVQTGKVMLADNSGSQSLALDPGYVGKVNREASEKTINDNPNYLAWNTGKLVYTGQKLDIVFKDLKRVYNMDIITDDQEILENLWTSPIDNQPQDTIIRLICASFNLSYSKDGNVYHLSKK